MPLLQTTVGFDATTFFGGAMVLVMLLRILQLVLGAGMYDFIVLGLIAAYHTKPDPSTFTGRPMKEMMAMRKELKEQTRPKKPPATGLDGFLGDP